MNVEKFVKDYSKSQNKEGFLKKRFVNTYVDYNRKITLCTNVLRTTLFQKVKVSVDKEIEVFKQNTPATAMLFSLTLVNEYTDIDVDFKNALNEFDMLEKEGLVDLLVNSIPRLEHDKFQTILNMVRDDIYENERSLIGYLDSKLTATELGLGSILDGLSVVNDDINAVVEK